jgi:HEPN domain-containing protein
MKDSTREWLRYANIDLQTAEEILNIEYVTPSVAFHTHQCIEKSFKAVLVEYDIVPPKIHNLLKLSELVKVHYAGIPIADENISYINETYIDARYPGDVGLLPNGAPSLEMAKEFYGTASAIHNAIISFLKQKDIDIIEPLPRKQPVFGCLKGQITIADDFDAPLL